MPDFLCALQRQDILRPVELVAEGLAPGLLAGHGLLAAGHLAVGEADHLPQILQLPLPRHNQALYLSQLPPDNRKTVFSYSFTAVNICLFFNQRVVREYLSRTNATTAHNIHVPLSRTFIVVGK